jgi:hypothetical protein
MSRELHDKMARLDRQFNGSIASLVEIYPQYKLTPGFQTYSTRYSQDDGTLTSVSADFHSLQQNARKRITTLNTTIQSLDRQIEDLVEENGRLGGRSRKLVGAKQSSIGQATTYRSVYRHHIFSAAALVAAGGIMVARMF